MPVHTHRRVWSVSSQLEELCVCVRLSICVSACVCPQVQPNPRHMTPPTCQIHHVCNNVIMAWLLLWLKLARHSWKRQMEENTGPLLLHCCPSWAQLFFYGQVPCCNCMDLIRDLHVSRNSCCFPPLSDAPSLPYILHNRCTALERLSSQVQPWFDRVEEGFQLKMFLVPPPRFNLHPPSP